MLFCICSVICSLIIRKLYCVFIKQVVFIINLFHYFNFTWINPRFCLYLGIIILHYRYKLHSYSRSIIITILFFIIAHLVFYKAQNNRQVALLLYRQKVVLFDLALLLKTIYIRAKVDRMCNQR